MIFWVQCWVRQMGEMMVNNMEIFGDFVKISFCGVVRMEVDWSGFTREVEERNYKQ